jgi:hypothetical protein
MHYQPYMHNFICYAVGQFVVHCISASARISKGQGYQVFLWKRAGEQFWPKKGNLRSYKEKLEIWTDFTPFRVNKMYSLKF